LEDGLVQYIIGIDVGGTFTDAFAADDGGKVYSAKVPSTPPEFATGVLASIDALAETIGVGVGSLLADTAYICHGTTASLNALVTGDVAEVGFLTTKGHRDSIYIMNIEGRYAGLSPEEIQAITATRKPKPLVPKRRVKEVVERVDYKGSVIVELDEEATRSSIRELVEDGVEAIAVSLLWSFRNPAHEHRVRELVHEIDPDMYVALSCEISPRIREYPRSATTVMSTQIGPTLRDYLNPLSAELEKRGLKGPLLIMQGSGGSVSAHEAPAYAITTIGSVLTGGVIGARTLGEQLGHRNIISTDVGGTTFLVGLVVDGEPVFESSTTLNQYQITVPMMKVATIGSGGGAVAWLDDGGNLRVGPRSAGAKPGPACYGQGGTEPTVSDANLVLGILDPDFFLGGTKKLDVELARAALQRAIGDPLGMSAEEAAAAVFEIQNSQTADLVRSVVVGAGHDPRDFTMYAFGGGGPAHCAAYGADLGVQEIVVPLGETAATFSAYGLATSDVVLSAELSDPANFPVDAATVEGNFRQLEEEVTRRLAEQRVDFKEVTMSREIDARYTMQIFEVATPVKGGPLDEAAVTQVSHDFEQRYASLFGAGSGFREAGMQFITYRVFGTGKLPFKPTLPHMAADGNGKPPVKTTRRAMLDLRAGWQDVSIYEYTALGRGHEIEGPAIVEAPTTTVVVPPGTWATVDQLGNLVIRYR
jgi:N-methylhydantoinase A